MMALVVITSETDAADEHAVIGRLFEAGLERLHVRKPHATASALEQWVLTIPAKWHRRLVLHQHHALVEAHRLGGCHWRDNATADGLSEAELGGTPSLKSRSSHNVAGLRASLGRFDSVLFGPVYPSISKPGYAPADAHVGEAVGAMLHTRTPRERRTTVLAIGGITAETAPRALALGFDGVAALGAIWQAADPVRAYNELLAATKQRPKTQTR